MNQKVRAIVGAAVLALGSISGVVAFAPAAYAQTGPAQSLADAIAKAANSVTGNGPLAAGARKNAVDQAIEQFMHDNGIDPSAVSSLITQAQGLLPADVAALPGVASGEAAASTNIAQTASTTKKSDGTGQLTTGTGVVSSIVTGQTVVTGGGGNPYGK